MCSLLLLQIPNRIIILLFEQNIPISMSGLQNKTSYQMRWIIYIYYYRSRKNNVGCLKKIDNVRDRIIWGLLLPFDLAPTGRRRNKIDRERDLKTWAVGIISGTRYDVVCCICTLITRGVGLFTSQDLTASNSCSSLYDHLTLQVRFFFFFH